MGELEEIVFESGTGKILYGAVSFNDMGVDDQLFAVPWEAVSLDRQPGEEQIQHLTLRIEVNRERLRDAEAFSEDRWPKEADRRLLGDEVAQPRTMQR